MNEYELVSHGRRWASSKICLQLESKPVGIFPLCPELPRGIANDGDDIGHNAEIAFEGAGVATEVMIDLEGWDVPTELNGSGTPATTVDQVSGGGARCAWNIGLLANT